MPLLALVVLPLSFLWSLRVAFGWLPLAVNSRFSLSVFTILVYTCLCVDCFLRSE